MINLLYLAEKPSQGRAIADALGITSGGENFRRKGDVVVCWLIGHLLQLSQPVFYEEKLLNGWNLDCLPLIPNDWHYDFPIDDESKTRFLKNIEEFLKQTKEVVISSDYDREGESLVREVLSFYGYKGKMTRIKIKDLNAKPILKAIDEKFDAALSENLNFASIARSRGDWLLGMNMTIGVTAANQGKLPPKTALHFGRVQSSILSIIIERYLEIKNFVPQNKYDIYSVFKKDNSEVRTKISIPLSEKSIETELDHNKNRIITDQKVINSIKSSVEKGQNYVSVCEKKRKEKAPDTGYSLSLLQTECNKKYKYSGEQTLAIAQSLYEKKLITYPRTDSGYLNTSLFLTSSDILKSLAYNYSNDSHIRDIIPKLDTRIKSPIWNDSKVDAHHGIIPTEKKDDISSLKIEEKNVYDLVVKMFLSQFAGNYVFDETKIVISSEDKYFFQTTGTIPVSLGFKTVYGSSMEKDESDDSDDISLPMLNVGDKVDLINVETKKDKTTPPKYYTDATLIPVLVKPEKYVVDPRLKKIVKDAGIGTEATRGNHIAGLIKRGYLKLEKNAYYPTEKGLKIYEVTHEYLKNPQTTIYWEQLLKNIENGEGNFQEFIDRQKKVVIKMMEDVKAGKCTFKEALNITDSKLSRCKVCDGYAEKIKSKKTKTYFWVCANKEQCGAFFTDNKGKIGDLIENKSVKCPCCNDGSSLAYRRKKKDSDKHFWVCQKCNTFFNDNDGSIGNANVKNNTSTSGTATSSTKIIDQTYPCNTCGEGFIIMRKGAKNNFWGCSNYPKCKQTHFDDNGKPKITDTK